MISILSELNFQNLDQAKVANSYINNSLSECLEIVGIFGINTFIDQKAGITITIRVEDNDAIKPAKEQLEIILETLRSSMAFREKISIGVCSYQYERNAVVTETEKVFTLKT